LGNRRDKIIEELKELIRQQRQKIDPRLLKMAEDAIHGRGKSTTAQNPPKPAGTEPYDRDAAAKTVALFLQKHKDASGFQKKMLDFIRKNTH
jgi:hypothetical protein